MTIDKCIEYFLENYAFETIEDGVCDDAKHHNEVLDYTIDTLRKYQKIKEILKDKSYDNNYYGDFFRINKIWETINDNK